MKVAPSEISALTALLRQESEKGSYFVVTPKTGAVTAHDLIFFASSFDAEERLHREPGQDLYAAYGLQDVLEALELVIINQKTRKEFTDSTQQQPLLDIGNLAILLDKRHQLNMLLSYVEWYIVEECIKVLSATETGKHFGREIWKNAAPHLMPLPAELSDSPQLPGNQRTSQAPSTQKKNSQKP